MMGHVHEPDAQGQQFGDFSGVWWAVCICGERIFRADQPGSPWRPGWAWKQ